MRKNIDGYGIKDYTDTELLHRAIKFAALAHKKHLRKGTKTPYIVHPFEAAMILTSEGCSIDIVIAGLLHDTVEDTSTSIDEIRNEFGKAIAAFVSGCTEDKSKSWEERKQHTIDFLAKEKNHEMLMLVCADKLSNLRSIKLDCDEYGEKLWERFTGGKTGQEWYFRELIDSLRKLEGRAMYEELRELYNFVFIR